MKNAELALRQLMLFCSGLPLQAVFGFSCRPLSLLLPWFPLGFLVLSYFPQDFACCSYEELLCALSGALSVGSQIVSSFSVCMCLE